VEAECRTCLILEFTDKRFRLSITVTILKIPVHGADMMVLLSEAVLRNRPMRDEPVNSCNVQPGPPDMFTLH
jgi:hypothetical protein